MEKLDLGENFLTRVPSDAFNGSLDVNDLNLDYNYIERLQRGDMAALTPRRLFMGMNR